MSASGILPEGLRIYAVGDIHGRFDLLEALTAMIGRDLDMSRPKRAIEVYLGDYVDRGPRSREVIEWLIKTPPLGDERICLMGNHEDLLLQAIESPAAMGNWLFNGGAETIASYLRAKGGLRDFSGPDDLRDAFLKALPESHRAFLSSLPRSAAFGGYLLVHAGVRPDRPLCDQDAEDLIWMREPFLSSDADFGAIVVHGHTPVPRPKIKENRIDIDTGAVFSGRLTCLVLEDATRRFMQTSGD